MLPGSMHMAIDAWDHMTCAMPASHVQQRPPSLEGSDAMEDGVTSHVDPLDFVSELLDIEYNPANIETFEALPTGGFIRIIPSRESDSR